MIKRWWSDQKIGGLRPVSMDFVLGLYFRCPGRGIVADDMDVQGASLLYFEEGRLLGCALPRTREDLSGL